MMILNTLIFFLSPTELDMNNDSIDENIFHGEIHDSGELTEQLDGTNILPNELGELENFNEFISETEQEFTGMSPDEMDRLYDQFQSEDPDNDESLIILSRKEL
jgi:hypothetical protein